MNRVKFYRQDSNKSLPGFPGRCDVVLGCHTNEFLRLAFHLLSFANHPSKYSPGFCAPNPGRTHRACSCLLEGGHPWGLPHTLVERRLRPRCEGMAGDRTRQHMCLPGVSTAWVAWCWPAAWRHCLGDFRSGQSWRRRALEFCALWFRIKSPLVGQWRLSLPSRPCSLFPVRWCVS